MSEQVPTPEQLVELLRGVLSGNNEKIQYASKVLRKYSKLPESVGPLVQIMQQNQDAGLRQLSSVLIRRQITTVFQQLNKQAQDELKIVLLQAFMQEPVNIIKKQIGFIIGLIAQQTLSKGEWPELYQVLSQQTSKDAQTEQRKAGIKLLSAILDYSGRDLKDFFGSFYDFFVVSIQDESKEIKTETAKCLVSLFDNIGDMSKQQIEQYKEIIPFMLNFLDQCVKEEDEDNVHTIFDSFADLAESKISILDNHFKVIVEYCCSNSILLNPKMPFLVKESVCDLIYVIADKHRSVFNKNMDLMKKAIETCCAIVSAPQNQEDNEKGENIQDTVLWLILTLSMNLNKKKIFGLLLQAITSLINSQDFSQQKTGFLILAQISEGCTDQLIKNLSNPIMNDFIPKGLSSANPDVKGACIKAIAYLTDYLGGTIIDYHHIIVPEIVKSFGDLNLKIQEKAMIALDIFCDSMETEQCIVYIPELIPKIVQVPYIQNVSITTKRAAISTIGSCISSAKEQFRNYVPQVYKLLHELILMKQTPENDVLTGEAISAIAKIAQAFSKNDQEVHNTVIVPVMEKIYDLLCNYGNYHINEGCFSFFYNLAEALGNQFEFLFDKVIEIALKSAASNEGVTYKKDGQEFSLDSDSEEDEDETINATSAHVKEGFLDEKSAAIHALGEFAVACPLKFKNYFEKTIGVLETVFDHFDENVRQQAFVCYKDLCIGMVKCANNGELPKIQKGLPCTQRFPDQIEQIICIDIWHKFLHHIRHETSHDSVAFALDGITNLIKKLGPAYIHANLDDLYDIILDVLENRLGCQNVSDDEDEEEAMEGIVFEAITDLIPVIAGALQAGFDLGYQRIFPSMMAYTLEQKDISEKVQMIGGFSQVFKKCDKVIIKQSLELLLPRLLNFVVENDDELSRNVAYCLGNIALNGKEFLKPEDVQNIMIALKHVFDNCDQAGKDNAASSLCRVIMSFPELVPIENAMDTVLSICPLTGDEEEERFILKCIVFLSTTKGEYLQKNIEKIVALFIDGLAKAKQYKIKNENKVEFVNFVKNLAANYKELVETTVMKLPEIEQKAVVAMLQ